MKNIDEVMRVYYVNYELRVTNYELGKTPRFSGLLREHVLIGLQNPKCKAFFRGESLILKNT